MSTSHRYIYLLGVGLISLLGCTTPSVTTQEKGPSPARTPAEEASTFQVEPGYAVQLVAAEPMVQDPVVITFDEDGRLWVVEMRGFMPTIDGEGEDEPVGRISVLEDTDGDGQMDRSTIYLDSLIMPRALALVPGGALVAENEALWLTQDQDGDLQADTKTLIDSAYAGSALPEHAGNGLWRGIDNWYYNAKSRFRYRLTNGEWQRDSTEFRGQWGMSHDDEGRLYYNYNWSQLHADLVPPNYLSRNQHHTPTTGIDHGLTLDRRIYPIRPNPAVNRGYIAGTLDEEGRLLEFTAACSPFYYRGTTLPDFYGNVFVCEPAGNLIKRNVVAEHGWQLAAHDPHPGREFLASSDERFRPVHLATGPDGALYVADMYRGLVQHGAYVTPYLREQTLARGLVQPIHRGRIWRVVPTGKKTPRPEKLSRTSSAHLVTYLSHPNGWYRDMAQRLLVERQDASVRSALTELARKGTNHLGRFHALWTLEGLELDDPDLLLALLDDTNPLISTTALRLLEPFALADRHVRVRLERALPRLVKKASAQQQLQIALTANLVAPAAKYPLLAGIAARYDTSALIRDAVISSLENQEFAFLRQIRQSPTYHTRSSDRAIFLEMLTTAIVRKRDPAELTTLLALVDHEDTLLDWQQQAVLNGLVVPTAIQDHQEPIRLASAPTILIRPEGSLDTVGRVALATLFDWPGKTVLPQSQSKQTIRDNETQQQLALGRQHYLTTCAGCHGTDGAGLNRFAPPLIGSDWVLGEEKQLALIILHGMEGPVRVNGKVYDAPEILPVMPAHSTMDDAAIAAILTYIRNAWGNQAAPVSRGLVGTTRHRTQGRVVPWSPEELRQHMTKTDVTVGQ